ncbi:MAG: hypothetical protein RL557_454 [archaeon]
MLIGIASAQGLYYELEIQYDSETVEIGDVDVIFSHDLLENMVNEIYFKTYSLSIIGDEVKKITFGFTNKQVYDEIDRSSDSEEFVSGGLEELENGTFFVYAPYDEKGKTIIIYDERGMEITQKEIKSLSNVDGDNREKESEQGNEEEQSEIAPAEKVQSISDYFYWIIGFVLLLLIGIVIYLLQSRKKKR